MSDAIAARLEDALAHLDLTATKAVEPRYCGNFQAAVAQLHRARQALPASTAICSACDELKEASLCTEPANECPALARAREWIDRALLAMRPQASTATAVG